MKSIVAIPERRNMSRPKRGRSRQGASSYVTVNATRSRNISVVAVMNKYRMTYQKIHDKVVTGEDFKTCLIEMKEATEAAKIDNPIFILDNARIHHYQDYKRPLKN